ncbi:CLIP domain-containing serine protease B4-like [Palaemon carinicauda]|uniref:CLIP domain-containing serine protease B4-like n=1 Tax=Palaemon carinicauda TaxID=392227 RepID=UPI0035B630D4
MYILGSPHVHHDHDYHHDHHHHDLPSDHHHDDPHNQSYASVQIPTNFRLDHCHPVLIHERFLLTSARCVLDPDEPVRQIRLGDQNPVDYEVLRIIVHPKYKPMTNERYNDIALLETKETIQFTEEIYPSCLSELRPTAGSVVIDNISDPGSGEDDNLEIIDSLQCEHIYKGEGIEVSLQNLILATDIFCADFKGSNKCERQTRGALFQDISEHRFLIGLVSKNASCTQPAALTLPGFYTSVADHIGFINNIIYP